MISDFRKKRSRWNYPWSWIEPFIPLRSCPCLPNTNNILYIRPFARTISPENSFEKRVPRLYLRCYVNSQNEHESRKLPVPLRFDHKRQARAHLYFSSKLTKLCVFASLISFYTLMKLPINYPLSEEKLKDNLQKIMLNLKYEYADGRLATTGDVDS